MSNTENEKTLAGLRQEAIDCLSKAFKGGVSPQPQVVQAAVAIVLAPSMPHSNP